MQAATEQTSVLQSQHAERAPGDTDRTSSVRIEDVPVVELECRVLSFLAQEAITGDKHLDLAAHKATKRVLGVQAIGSPRTLKLVLTRTGHPVFALKSESRA